MEQLFRFFSPEAGQRRRTALDSLFAGVERYIPPNLRPAAETAAQMNPIQGMGDAMQAGGIVFDPNQTSEARKRAAIDMGMEMAISLTPAALAKLGYLTVPTATMETLLGGSPAAQKVGQDIVNLASDAQYAGRSLAEGDFGGVLDAVRPGVEPQSLSAASSSGPSNPKSKTILMPDGSRIPRPKTMAEVPDIRNMSVQDALFVARQEPHLIEAGDSSRGAYIGGPEKIKGRRSLNSQRAFMDNEIDAGDKGGDWYDRYRQGVEAVTSNTNDQTWMSNLEGMYSAGVAPNNELAFALKDTNSAVAYGVPGKPYTPKQQEASLRAIETNDPFNYMLGKKTGEYARRVNPQAATSTTATGVNDFRHLRTLGFTETSGAAQRNAVGEAGHKYADYETALAVERANQRNLAGRSNWTGEQIQAAPWVKQKADDLYARSEKRYLNDAQEILTDQGSNFAPGELEKTAYSLAFADANKTIADFFPNNTAFATYEAQPFIDAGQLPGLGQATEAQRVELAAMPESTWANTNGRDDIYANTRLGNTGVAVRTQPTTAMQGVYTPPQGVTEFNPGEVARPLVAFNLDKSLKSLPEADRAIMDAGEATRAFIDVQGAGAWHKPFVGGPATQSNSIFAALENPRPLEKKELGILQKIGEKYGLPDVVDTGQGATITSFYPEPKLPSSQAKGLLEEIKNTKIFKGAERAKVDSGYLGFEDAWRAGEGSGEATRNLLNVLDGVPSGVYKAFNNNEAIAENALRRMERDEKLASSFGATRKDIANARKIIGEGKGWIDRLRKALDAKAILPGVAALALTELNFQGSRDDEF